LPPADVRPWPGPRSFLFPYDLGKVPFSRFQRFSFPGMDESIVLR